jgi:hypothetical protein
VSRRQTSLFFDGETYEPKHDEGRLGSVLDHVRRYMLDPMMTCGPWRTLAEIAAGLPVDATEAGISARLRDLRKERFGSYIVERRRRGDPKAGLFEYRVRRP